MTLIGTAAVLQHVPTQMAVPLQVVTSVAEHTAHSAVTVVMSSQMQLVCSFFKHSNNNIEVYRDTIQCFEHVIATNLACSVGAQTSTDV